MVIAAFQIKDKLGRAQFFQKIFLLADSSMKMIIEIPFHTFSNADIQFAEKKLTWRFYTTEKALLITRQVKLINKKKFAKTKIDENVEAFVVYITSFTLKTLIDPAQKA